MQIKEVDPAQLSSAIKQYYDIKINHLDKIVFFQLGDFYEMFFEDALFMAKECDLALTGKSAGLAEKIPMSGVPLQNGEEYIKRVINLGKKVVLVTQEVDSKDAKLINRRIKKIYTKANLILDGGEANYVAILAKIENNFALSVIEPTTMEAFYFQTRNLGEIISFISSHNIVECISLTPEIGDFAGVIFQEGEVKNIKELNSYLIDWIEKSTYTKLSQELNFQKREFSSLMKINRTSAKALELIPYDGIELKQTLFGYLNRTHTAMGRRYLKEQILSPLLVESQINDRLDYVDFFLDNHLLTLSIIEELKSIYDLERIGAKINEGVIAPKDVVHLRASLNAIKNLITLITPTTLNLLQGKITQVEELLNLINVYILPEPALSLKDGGVINRGLSADLDHYHYLQANSKQWFDDYVNQQRAELGTKNLKIGYNRIFGYYIEVSKASLDLVPNHYQEKQTLANAKRYMTDELASVQEQIQSATTKIIELEQHFYEEFKSKLKNAVLLINELAEDVAFIDFIQSLSAVARDNFLVRPTFNQNNEFNIIGGFHPVLKSVVDDFIINDFQMQSSEKTLVITGPNMSGKSTYMRQVALIVIMGQMGSFVPAQSANIAIVDQIFTRIGASDDGYNGASTFMVEMSESAAALAQATDKSLLIFDELGRGTSTYDGMSIAASIIEYATNVIGCKTLFSTHYHELVTLEQRIPGIKNVHVEAKTRNEELIFLHKVTPGGVGKSYGIEVAKLANLPTEVIIRSKEYLNHFSNENSFQAPEVKAESDKRLLELEVLLNGVDINYLTPIASLDYLQKIINILKEDDGN